VYEVDETTAPSVAGMIQFKVATGAVQKGCVVASGGPYDAGGDGAAMFIALLPQRCVALVRNEVAAHGPGAMLELSAGLHELVYNAVPTAPVAKLAAYHTAGAAAVREVSEP
jgi:hypothetical protein